MKFYKVKGDIIRTVSGKAVLVVGTNPSWSSWQGSC